MKKKMETSEATICDLGFRVILGLYRDNGTETGTYHNITRFALQGRDSGVTSQGQSHLAFPRALV